ncbi:MAG: serpin family protein [Dehalococcoidia bacterium]|nr:serpin family protein [Dehalococcoidia bacterium]
MKTKIAAMLGLVIMLTAALPACGQPASADVIRSGKARVMSPAVSQSDMAALVEGDNVFAFNLYRSLKGAGGNMFFSPYSISVALAMTYAGARGLTQQQMADTLHYTLPQENLHPAFNNLDAILASRGEGAKGKDGEGFRLNIVNAIWGQKGYKFLSGYLDLLAENYGAGLRLMDFINAPENCRQVINQWVSDQTEDRIKDLIPADAINSLTRLVLTNAIYFNAAWANPFEEMLTKPDIFYLVDGTEVKVPMMHQVELLDYLDGDNFQAVELPYDGRELSMLIILPDSGKFNEIENSLHAEQVNGIIKSLDAEQVGLSMPSFEFESSFGLNKTLSEMGMPIAFSTNADFSGMIGSKDLRISDVIHKAFISTDESGTEAAAATAVVMEATAMPGAPLEMKIDRPFIFLIRDIETGTVLFIGRMMNPQA